ncbi:hypothetical protein ROZALSC1DRAFT_26852, partial [Rozella allomycis CSF55]
LSEKEATDLRNQLENVLEGIRNEIVKAKMEFLSTTDAQGKRVLIENEFNQLLDERKEAWDLLLKYYQDILKGKLIIVKKRKFKSISSDNEEDETDNENEGDMNEE